MLSGGSQINGPALLSVMGYTIGERNVLDILQFDWLKDNVYISVDIESNHITLLFLQVINFYFHSLVESNHQAVSQVNDTHCKSIKGSACYVTYCNVNFCMSKRNGQKQTSMWSQVFFMKV